MVQYKAAILGLVSSLLFAKVNAFTPSSSSITSKLINSSNPAAQKMEVARTKVENLLIGGGNNEYTHLVDSMKMVAGGAQAEEYYEGESDS
jgi:hypothetical protein